MTTEITTQPKNEIKNISLKLLTLDTDVQPRRTINEKTVAEYAEAIETGAKFPPVVVFMDGPKFWLASGFHRYAAHEKAGKRTIRCEVRQGTKRDAILFAKRANKHGLHLTNEEKRDNVDEMLRDEEWKKWSDNEIARHIGVSQPFVSSRREFLTNNVISENDDSERKYVTKHGTEATMNTANIGQKTSPQVPADAIEDDEEFASAFDGEDEDAPTEIPTESEPEIAEPEPTEPEPDEPSLDEQIEAAPLFAALSHYGHGGRIFFDQARIWEKNQELLRRAHAATRALQYTTGPVTEAIRTLAAIPHWSQWQGCPQCFGSLRVGERADPCPACKGGFTVHPDQGVKPDVIVRHAAGSASK